MSSFSRSLFNKLLAWPANSASRESVPRPGAYFGWKSELQPGQVGWRIEFVPIAQLRKGFLVGKGVGAKNKVPNNLQVEANVHTNNVSRSHWRMKLVGDELRIRDLESSNGSTYNGSPFAWSHMGGNVVLTHGDVVSGGLVSQQLQGVHVVYDSDGSLGMLREPTHFEAHLKSKIHF